MKIYDYSSIDKFTAFLLQSLDNLSSYLSHLSYSLSYLSYSSSYSLYHLSYVLIHYRNYLIHHLIYLIHLIHHLIHLIHLIQFFYLFIDILINMLYCTKHTISIKKMIFENKIKSTSTSEKF